MKLTMKELAQQLGISRTAVSLVLKGEGDRYRISRETQQRVLEKARDLKYRPNYFAQALNRGKTMVIGVVFPNIHEAFMAEVVRGIEKVIYPAGYTMMLSTSRFSRELESHNLEQLQYRGIDGYLVVFSAPFKGHQHDYSHLSALVQQNRPVVFIDRYLPELGAPYVVQDDYGSAREAVSLLASQGCRSVGFISLDIDITTIRDRFRGYRAALSDCGSRLHEEHVLWLKGSDPATDDLRRGLRALRDKGIMPEGFLVTTSGLSLKTAAILEELGMVLNRDIRVAKFGADPEYPPTGLICVEQPHVQMGESSARMLLRLIQDGEELPEEEKHVVLKAQIKEPGRTEARRVPGKDRRMKG